MNPNFDADDDTPAPPLPMFDDDAMFVSLDRPTFERSQAERLSRWSAVSGSLGDAADESRPPGLPSPASSYAPAADLRLNLALARNAADSARFTLKPLRLLSNSDAGSSGGPASAVAAAAAAAAVAASPASPPVSPVRLGAALSRATSTKSRSDSLSTTHTSRTHLRPQSPEPPATASIKRQLSDGFGKLRTKFFDKSLAAAAVPPHALSSQSDTSMSSVSLSEFSENDMREFVQLESQLLLRQRNNSVGTSSAEAPSPTATTGGNFLDRVVRPSTSQSFSASLRTQVRHNDGNHHQQAQMPVARPSTSLEVRWPSAAVASAPARFPRPILTDSRGTTSLDIRRAADSRPSFDYSRAFSLDQHRPLSPVAGAANNFDDTRSVRSAVRARFQVSAAHNPSSVAARRWPTDWLRKLGVVAKR
ncbi:hypothetical protein HDU83_003291 [Entophlyctis luteolus]|nr:hypothetical protein HDU83_003291 [Entophlyctis luteolus]